MIHSLSGTLPEGGLIKTRPFRDPHHSASLPALVGGGQKAKPGEISLAHHGVLFLDELPEFARATLESLRQPLETGRAEGTGEISVVIAARVQRARDIQAARYSAYAGQNPTLLNAHAPPELIEKTVILEDEARALLNSAAEKLKLSARAYHRLLRVARTIADLADAPETLGRAHIAEALSYRRLRVD